MNLNMPEMVGGECYRLIKGHPVLQQIPVVLVIFGDSVDEMKRCREAGCDDIVSKPINRHLFLQTAGHYLNIIEHASPRVSARMRIHYGIGEQQLRAD